MRLTLHSCPLKDFIMNIVALTLKAMENTPAKEFGDIARMQYDDSDRRSRSGSGLANESVAVRNKDLGLLDHS